ncbi:MAG TPA: SDR family NAD(P)-dependent oxidoreductase [Polyangia bacterium]|jgi:NADP-dependent 3-hydroxy acid dehydrogenase YdfG
MAKTMIVCGYGPGISNAVAERFGREGFKLALVARNAARLDAAAKRLRAEGIVAEPFVADLGRPDSARTLVQKVRAKLGPISAFEWTAYSPAVGDLLGADADAVRSLFDAAIAGLLTVVQEALPDLRSEKGAILVTNGGLALIDEKVDAVAVSWNAMGLALANAAKHKLVALLAQKLKGDGVYVGEVMVNGTVKGTAFDKGNATIDPALIGEKFWQLYQTRAVTFANI